MIVDASVLYAAADADDSDNRSSVELLSAWSGPLVVSAFNAAEADSLILDRLGVDAELRFFADLTGAYILDMPDNEGIEEAAEICRGYADLELGLADASILVLAKKWRTCSIATLDQRDFLALRPLYGDALQLLPE
jgi:uncharacterized protein